MAESDEAEVRLLTVAEVAERLAVPKRTVQLFCQRGELAHFRVGRAYRISEEHLSEFLDASEFERAG